MTSSPPGSRLYLALGVMLAAGVLACCLMAKRDIAFFGSHDLLVDGIPLINNNDGYYHLDQARRLATDGGWSSLLGSSPYNSLLLPAILAATGGNDDTSLLKTSAFIGPILGLTMLLALAPWAMETRYPGVVLAAPLLAYLAPNWIEWTHIGALDTDCLVPFAVYSSLFCLMRFATTEHRRLRWLSAYLASPALLWMWWKPGAFLCLGLIGLYLLYRPLDRKDWPIKLFLLALAAVIACLAMAGVEPFSEYARYLVKHSKLAFGNATDSIISRSIIELQEMSLTELGDQALGGWWLLPLAGAGAVFYCLRQGWRSLFLVALGVISALAALYSRRFIILFIPAAAFFTIYAVVEACERLASQRGFGNWIRIALATPCLCLVLAGAANRAVSFEPNIYFKRTDYELAQRIRAEFPANTVIWTWWDYGYFFRFLTGMRPLFDGGSQTNRTCFTASYPLMQTDMSRAAAWMRRFADDSPPRLRLAHRGAGWQRYLEGIADGSKNDKKTPPVALCIPARVYTAVGFLYSFAHIFDAEVPPVKNHLELFRKDGFHYRPESGEVFVPEEMVTRGYTGFGSVLNVTGRTPDQINFDALSDPYLIYSHGTDFLAVTDRPLVDSVLFRLLGMFDYDHKLFDPVYFDYRHGGIWRVR